MKKKGQLLVYKKCSPFLFFLFYICIEEEQIVKESEFQAKLIREIKERFPGCYVLKNDPTYLQGVPDLLILYKTKWAALEVKTSSKAHHQPNQDFYVKAMDEMSFASFIFPENKEVVLNAMEQALGS